MICVLKLVTNLVKVNRFGEKVRSLTESSRRKLAEALATSSRWTRESHGHCG